MISIAIVACCFRLAPEDVVRRVRRTLGPSIDVEGFAVSAHLDAERPLGKGWTALPTDNLDFDFSAYFTGAQAVVDRGLADRLVLFLNDTLFTNHSATANLRAIVRLLELMQKIELPAMAGKTDLYTTMCLRSPWSGLDRYVTTFCFVVNPQSLQMMLQLRDWASEDDVTHEHDIHSTSWGTRLPGQFRQFVKANIAHSCSPYLWYRLRDKPHAPEQLRSKARCIYFEHRLSGAVGQAGCLLPTNAGPRWRTYLAAHELLSHLWRRVLP